MVSTCEKEFVLKCLLENERIDRRDVYSYRHLHIEFGIDRGCCHVDLGQTKVMCQVSCQVVAPRATRESEGTLQLNVELPAMAHRTFDTGRQSDLCTEITRLLERAIRDSRCVDTESLCIVTAEKVWCVRVDIHVLNHDGNLLDAACIAAIGGLAHFRRPDVTVTDGELHIHPPEEREPVPLTIFHWPIFVTLAWYHQGRCLLIDPSLLEERCMEGKMLIAMNAHREVCTLHAGGSMLLVMEQVNTCVSVAAAKVADITQCVRTALRADDDLRQAAVLRADAGAGTTTAPARGRHHHHHHHRRYGFADLYPEYSHSHSHHHHPPRPGGGANGESTAQGAATGGGGGGDNEEVDVMELAPEATAAPPSGQCDHPHPTPPAGDLAIPPPVRSGAGASRPEYNVNAAATDIGSGGASTWETGARPSDDNDSSDDGEVDSEEDEVVTLHSSNI